MIYRKVGKRDYILQVLITQRNVLPFFFLFTISNLREREQ